MKRISGSLAAMTMTMTLMTALAACASDPAKRSPERQGLEPISEAERARTIEAMKPPKRARPIVAVLAQNDGAETTDYVIPYSVLAESGAADVFALATEDRALQLTPALTILPQMTTAAFTRAYPDGADYVIVPRIDAREDPTLLSFIREESAKGSMIVGVCAGVLTLSSAGLLTDRAATSHWKEIETLKKENPTMRYVPNRRYVVDGNVITTTGVSASLPISLALVEAIAGPERAQEVGARLGVRGWTAEHDSDRFFLDSRMGWTALSNKASLWSQETFAIDIVEGVDELALAFGADSWSRTFRSRALTVASEGGARMQSRRGLTIVADAAADDAVTLARLPAPDARAPATSLRESLLAIRSRYGEDTAAFVALQLEYAWPEAIAQ